MPVSRNHAYQPRAPHTAPPAGIRRHHGGQRTPHIGRRGSRVPLAHQLCVLIHIHQLPFAAQRTREQPDGVRRSKSEDIRSPLEGSIGRIRTKGYSAAASWDGKGLGGAAGSVRELGWSAQPRRVAGMAGWGRGVGMRLLDG